MTLIVLAEDALVKRSVLQLANCPENEMRLDENNLRLDKAAGQELRRKIDFTTAGRDPCLADGFIMKTLVPDDEKMNDVPHPDNDDDSVETKVGNPASIEKAPDLPENCNEEMLSPPVKEEPSEALKGKRGHRTKKDTFQGSHQSDRSDIPICQSSRSQRDANVWEALDPTKSKLDQEIEKRAQSCSPKQKKEEVERPTLKSEGHKTHKSAVANPPLQDQPLKKWTDQDQDD